MGNEQSSIQKEKSKDLFPVGGNTNGHSKKKSLFSKMSSKGKKSGRRRSSSSAPTVSTLSDHATSVYEPQKVVVIGAGPVGALAALYFARGGWLVTVYELRGDLRNPENRSLNFTKSINLAISERGLNGLRCVDPEIMDAVLEETIPMHGRMIHDKKGRQSSQKYDNTGNFIRAVDRGKLNERLLDELEKMNNVDIKFNHNLRSLALERGEAIFEKRHSNGDYDTVRVQSDLFIGADGAHSQTRRQLMKYVRLNYQQEYIDSLWCELQIAPDPKTGDFQLNPNHLHIWPRQTFMFIALPNNDKTFTCTLFMPESMFQEISGPESLVAFFNKEFPDVLPLMTEERLIAEYYRNPKLPLISLKCTPYNYKDRCVIIGDASHAMVPFYGQGMNCGFEDVRVLWEHIANDPTIETALNNYTKQRHPDCVTINDLAMNNYIEMSSSVTSYGYLMKKHIQEFCHRWMPFMGIRTMYSMVSFSNIRYSEVLYRVRRQELILGGIGWLIIGGVGVGGVYSWRKGYLPVWMHMAKVWKEQLQRNQFFIPSMVSSVSAITASTGSKILRRGTETTGSVAKSAAKNGNGGGVLSGLFDFS